MKSRPTLLIGAMAHVFMTLSQAHAANFSLTTPGSASWEVFQTDLGTRTVIRVEGDTVLDWDDFQLGSGSELVFDFVGGSTVTNQLAGGGVKSIDGSVIANGVVGFFAPEADIVVNGSISAKGVVISTLEGNAGILTQGGILQAGSGTGAGQVRVYGSITATEGDVLIAGSRVSLFSSSVVDASDSVMLAGSSRVALAPSGEQRLYSAGETGLVRHLGRVQAQKVEMVAGGSIRNAGVIDTGSTGKVFLTVGDSGEIVEDLSAVIVGDKVVDGLIKAGAQYTALSGIDGDSAPAVSDGSLRIPALRRPDGSTVSGSRTVTYTSTMSASSEAARARASDETAERSAPKQEKASLLQRGSLFGLRGGVTRGGSQSSNSTSRR
ncbi:MAG: hypothetical protein MUF31_06105 [Akkermansiaceae bacterium]|jgi:hypothetical protein|nr:hypothetical protein [Akkermansiaceae bacterium]